LRCSRVLCIIQKHYYVLSWRATRERVRTCIYTCFDSVCTLYYIAILIQSFPFPRWISDTGKTFLCFIPFVGYVYRVINQIFSEVDDHIAKDTLITDLKMSALPNLYNQFVRLIKLLVNFDYRAFVFLTTIVFIQTCP